MKKIFKGSKQTRAILSSSTIAVVSALNATTVQAADVTPQIVGGIEWTLYSRPYQVALLMNGRQGCGGTLIQVVQAN